MRGIGIVLVACAALAGSVVAQATGSPKVMVNDAKVQGEGFPRVLAEYAFFQDGGAREASDFVRPYELNTPLFSDGAA